MAAPADLNDPNWLYSSCAQSTAALVAIVGGLLVSRLVVLSSEARGLRQRRANLERELSIVEQQLEAVDAERLTGSIQEFADGWEEDLARNEVRSVEALLDWIPRGATREELAPFAEILWGWAKDARAAAEAGTPIPERFDDESKRNLYKAVYADVRRRKQAGVIFGGSDPAPKQYDQSELAEHRRVRDRVYGLTSRRDALLADLDVVGDAIAQVAAPTGLLPAAFVLTYFSVVSVLWPLVLMAFRPVPDQPWVRALTVVLFATGLGGLISYIVWYARTQIGARDR